MIRWAAAVLLTEIFRGRMTFIFTRSSYFTMYLHVLYYIKYCIPLRQPIYSATIELKNAGTKKKCEETAQYNNFIIKRIQDTTLTRRAFCDLYPVVSFVSFSHILYPTATIQYYNIIYYYYYTHMTAPKCFTRHNVCYTGAVFDRRCPRRVAFYPRSRFCKSDRHHPRRTVRRCCCSYPFWIHCPVWRRIRYATHGR